MKINGKNITIKELDFNGISDLSELGIEVTDLAGVAAGLKAFPVVRAFVALNTGTDKQVAGELLQQHILGGGTLDELFGAIAKSIEGSGFLQTLLKRQEKKPKTTKVEETTKAE